MSHSICLHTWKICVVLVETKPERNSRQLPKVLSTLHFFACYFGIDPRIPTSSSITVNYVFYKFFWSLVKSNCLVSFILTFCYDYFTPCEYFTVVLADRRSMMCEWQQFSSGVQDSSEYSSRFLQCRTFDSLNPPLLQFNFQAFWDHSKRDSYTWFHPHPQLFFSSRVRSKYFSLI